MGDNEKGWTDDEILSECQRRKQTCENNLAASRSMLASIREDNEKLKLIEISQLEYRDFGSAPSGLAFQLTNHTDKIIINVELEAILSSPGRKIPWAMNPEIKWTIAGGLNPGETRSCFLLGGDERKNSYSPNNDVLWGVLKGAWSLYNEKSCRVDVRVTAACACDPDDDSEAESCDTQWKLGTADEERQLQGEMARAQMEIDIIRRYLEQFECRTKGEDQPASSGK